MEGGDRTDYGRTEGFNWSGTSVGKSLQKGGRKSSVHVDTDEG